MLISQFWTTVRKGEGTIGEVVCKLLFACVVDQLRIDCCQVPIDPGPSY